MDSGAEQGKNNYAKQNSFPLLLDCTLNDINNRNNQANDEP
jgi:hypothetical protein